MKIVFLTVIFGLLIAACSPASEGIDDLTERPYDVSTVQTHTETSVIDDHPTETPQLKFCPYNPPKPTSTDATDLTQQPQKLTYQEIENYYYYSEEQWESYFNEITGLRVRWFATVIDIDEQEIISLDMGQKNNNYIYMDGLSKDVLLNLHVGAKIEFDATIEDITTSTGLIIWLIEPVVIIFN